MIQKIRDVILHHHSRSYCAFPALSTLASGRLLLAFRRARDHRWLLNHRLDPDHPDFDRVDHVDPRSHTVLITLDSQLTPTAPPRSLAIDPEAADQDSSLLTLTDGRVLLAGFTWYPVASSYQDALRALGAGFIGSADDTGCLFVFWGGHTRLGDSHGEIWTPHHYLPPLPDGYEAIPGLRPEFGGAVRGRPAQRPDGTILVATYTVDRQTARYASHLFASTDGGGNWHHRSLIARDTTGRVGYAEPALLTLPDGRLMALHRSSGVEDRLITTTSNDDGHSWNAPVVEEVRGHPYDGLDLGDGRVLLVYGYRHQPMGIRARIWSPGLEAPGDAPEVVLRDDGRSRDLGYPWAARMADGSILIAYYMADEAGIRHIAGTQCTIDPA